MPDLGFTVEEMVLYFNLGLLATLASAALWGFLQGFKESLFHTLMFAGFVIGGFLASGMIAGALLNLDISTYTSLEFSGVQITTIRAFITEMAGNQMPELVPLLEGDTLASSLVTELSIMVLRLIVVIVILVLAFTVWKVISWIVWLFIKGKKKKKTMTSRLGGAAFGAARALLIILMIAVPLAGIASIATSLGGITPVAQEDGDPYTILLTADNATLLAESPETDIDQAIEFLSFYNQSWFAQAMQTVQIEGSSLDQLIFDQMFSFKFQEDRVMLRQELVHVANIYQTLMENVGPDMVITIDTINDMGEEALTNIVTSLSELKLIRVAVLVGAEAVLEGGLFEIEAIDLAEVITMEQVLELDLKNEIVSVGTALIEVVDVLATAGDGPIDFFSLDTEKVESVFTNLGNLGLIDVLGPVGISYVMSMPEVTEFLGDSDFDFDEIDWGKEIANLGSIYTAFRGLGITSFDTQTLDFNVITETSIDTFSNALFDSSLISQATPALVDYMVTNMLPAEFAQYLSIEKIRAVTWDGAELSSLLKLGKVVLSSGALDENFDFASLLSESTADALATYLSESELISGNLSPIIRNLLTNTEGLDFLSPVADNITDDFNWSKEELVNILGVARLGLDMMNTEGGFNFDGLDESFVQDLSTYMSDSVLISMSMSPLVDALLTQAALPFTLTQPQDLEWDYDETYSLLNGVRVILNSGVTESGFDFATMEDTLIVDIADTLTGSTFLNHNLTPIFTELTSSIDLGGVTLVIEPEFVWTHQEITSILRSAKLIFANGGDVGALVGMSDTDLDTILGSRLLTKTLVSAIENYAAPGNALADILVIDLEEEEWYDEYTDEIRTKDGELRKLFKSMQVLLGDNIDINNVSFDINNLLNLDDTQMTTLLDSKVINTSVVSQLVDYAAPGAAMDGVLIVNLAKSDPEWQDTYVGEDRTDGELRKLLRGLKVLLGENVDINNVSFDINNILNLTENQTDDLLASTILNDSIVNQIVTLSSPGNSLDGVLVVNEAEITWEDSYVGETRTDGELRLLLSSLKVVLGENVDINNVTFEVNNILFLSDPDLTKLVASKVVTDSIENQLVTMSSPGNSLDGVLVVPSALEWQGDSGEAKRLIKALEVLVGPGGDINTLDLDVSVFFDDLTQPVLLASEVVEASAIHTITSSTPAQNGTLVIPSGTVWEGETGELIKFLDALEVIIGPSGDIETLDVTVNIFFDDAKQPVLLASSVIEATVIQTITDSAPAQDGTLVIPSGTVWEGESGELIRFLGAIEIIMGESGDLETFDFDINVFFDDVKQPILLASTVMEASIINQIETSAPVTNGTLIIPGGTVWEGESGELVRFLDAIEVILGPSGDFETLDFSVNVFFDDQTQPVLLASTVMEASIINQIETSQPVIDGTLVIPVGTVWEGPSGELVRFLDAMEEIIGVGGDFETLSLDVDDLLDKDLDLILTSRVLEASIAPILEDMFAPGGVLDSYMDLPGDTNWYREYDPTFVEGDLLPFLEAIRMMRDTGIDYNTLTLSAFQNADSGETADALLHSRIIAMNISKMMNTILENAGVPDPVDPPYIGYRFTEPYTWTKVELVDALDDMKSVTALLGI